MCAHDYEKLIIYYYENQKCGLGGGLNKERENVSRREY